MSAYVGEYECEWSMRDELTSFRNWFTLHTSADHANITGPWKLRVPHVLNSLSKFNNTLPSATIVLFNILRIRKKGEQNDIKTCFDK